MMRLDGVIRTPHYYNTYQVRGLNGFATRLLMSQQPRSQGLPSLSVVHPSVHFPGVSRRNESPFSIQYVCIYMYQYVPVCTSMHNMHQYTPVCTCVHQYGPVCTSLDQYVQYAPVCNDVHEVGSTFAPYRGTPRTSFLTNNSDASCYRLHPVRI